MFLKMQPCKKLEGLNHQPFQLQAATLPIEPSRNSFDFHSGWSYATESVHPSASDKKSICSNRDQTPIIRIKGPAGTSRLSMLSF